MKSVFRSQPFFSSDHLFKMVASRMTSSIPSSPSEDGTHRSRQRRPTIPNSTLFQSVRATFVGKIFKSAIKFCSRWGQSQPVVFDLRHSFRQVRPDGRVTSASCTQDHSLCSASLHQRQHLNDPSSFPTFSTGSIEANNVKRSNETLNTSSSSSV